MVILLFLCFLYSIVLSRNGCSNSFRHVGFGEFFSSQRCITRCFASGFEGAPKLDTNECYYKVLEVQASCSQRDIKEAFWKLLTLYHPDKKRTLKDKELANRQMMIINIAYETLKDPVKRKQYDVKITMKGNAQYDRQTEDASVASTSLDGQVTNTEQSPTMEMESPYEAKLHELNVSINK